MLAALLAGLCVAGPAHAVLQDEIQVYDDSINKPGQWGLELHLNSTPSGISTREYPGEIQNVHGVRGTPEISYGLTDTLEAGLYLPVVHDASGATEFAGPRVRMKWIPRQAPETGGLFYGVNVELSAVKPRYEQYQNSMELRPIIGFRTPDWLFAANPSLDYPLRAGYRQGGPDFDPGVKVARTVTQGIAAGFEYYGDVGSINGPLPFAQQNHVLFLALDVDRKPWIFNVGIGRGLTSSSDRWTLKSIFEIPFD
ncbi:MAG: hypothetical protein KGI82_09565 [Betaproteobacteria bacterium]|nr:hypothetical protein [Betaproteobacteria bacterium]